MPDNDSTKYFRIEARELLDALSQGVLALEKGIVSRDLIGGLLRQAHTLKGAARVVNQSQIAELSHAIEDLLSPHRLGASPPSPVEINRLLANVDEIAAALRKLEPEAEPAHTHAARGLEEQFETVRVDLSAMDEFLHDVSRTSIYQNAVKRELGGFDSALALADFLVKEPGPVKQANRLSQAPEELRMQLRRLRQNLNAAADKVDRELMLIQERAADLRLIPASAVFSSLERAVRDAADSLGRKVAFYASGGENHLDGHILRAMRDALLHVVRNAVAHGIEPAAERIASGKPAEGSVKLSVERRGDRLIFICEDDGRGIDLAQVSGAALSRGLISEGQAAALDAQAAVDLLLRGGLTTTRDVNQVSGRGLGLDVVREVVSRLKGDTKGETIPAKGTTITLSVPISLEARTVLEVEVSGSIVALPFDATVRALRIAASDIARAAHGESVLFDGQALPFAPLISLLRPAMPRPQREFWSVFIIQGDSRMAAVGVDRLLRKTDVVMRPLPPLAGQSALIAGASLDSGGDPQLVIDAHELVKLIARVVPADAESRIQQTLPLLVIDDSLTTRMLEQSILERAGYDVDVAVSGEEALKKARQRQYGMFILDIEMPGIDGFEFIERCRAEPQLRDVPAILVSSRASIEDRQRGEQVGARAYIVKSEFNEGQLLETIRRLIE